MSMEKAIKSGKEKRKEYTGSKAIDHACRNHGSCDWCKENRMIHSLKEEERTRYELENFDIMSSEVCGLPVK